MCPVTGYQEAELCTSPPEEVVESNEVTPQPPVVIQNLLLVSNQINLAQFLLFQGQIISFDKLLL